MKVINLALILQNYKFFLWENIKLLVENTKTKQVKQTNLLVLKALTLVVV